MKATHDVLIADAEHKGWEVVASGAPAERVR